MDRFLRRDSYEVLYCRVNVQFNFQKYTWILKFLIIGLIAILLAVGINRVLAIYLAPLTVPEISLTKSKKSKNKKISSRLKNFSSPIKKRCLFGCLAEDAVASAVKECPDGCAIGETCQDGTCVVQTDLSGENSSIPVKSDLSAKLLGVMVAGDAEYSTALIVAGEQTYVIGIGETILEAQIVEIRRDRVIFKRNGRLEYLKLENSIGGNPRIAAARASGLSKAAMDLKPTSYPDLRPSIPQKASTSNSKKGVRKISPTDYELDEGFLDQLSDTKKLASQASIAPNYDAAGVKRNGIKMMGIRSGSVFDQIGIKSNDVVQKINGTKIQNQAHALELLKKLKGKKSASIQIERKGGTKVLKYKVNK